jgi:hypothetical protein
MLYFLQILEIILSDVLKPYWNNSHVNIIILVPDITISKEKK